jgi:hypothetical protein
MFCLLRPTGAFVIAALSLVLTYGPRSTAQQLPPDATKTNQNNVAPPATTSDDENFSDLHVNRKAFLQTDPVVIESDDKPEYTLEFLDVRWRVGDPIHLAVIKPAGIKNPPVILYLNSYPSETSVFLNPNFCKFAVKNGFAAVGFVSALTGHRYHNMPMREWFVSNLDQALGSSVHDVQLVLDYLSIRGDLDMNRVGMFGDGSGATIGILAAAVDPRIKVLDLLDPWGDWPSWMAKSTLVPEEERPDYVKPEFLRKVAPFDPVLWLPQLKGTKVRLQEVGDVTVTPDDARKRIEKAAPAMVDTARYENRETFLTDVAQKGTALDWMKDRLQGGKLTADEDSRKDKTMKLNR